MDNLAFIGGGGHAKVLLGIVKKLKRYHVLGYADLENRGNVLGAAYLGTDRQLASLVAEHGQLNVLLAVGQTGLGLKRSELWSQLRGLPLLFPPLVSSDAIVNEGVQIGEGAVIMDGAVVNCDAVVGRGVIVNTNSTVEHDVEIADWVHIAPGATVCGGCRVGQFSMIGAGATIIQGISIAAGCLIGAGAVVVTDINAPGVYLGCPARRIKEV
jgi:UDP-perosamine 4-acetyltransferase